jgi:hypothetical protein
VRALQEVGSDGAPGAFMPVILRPGRGAMDGGNGAFGIRMRRETRPFLPDEMAADPVSFRVNKTGLDDGRLIGPAPQLALRGETGLLQPLRYSRV